MKKKRTLPWMKVNLADQKDIKVNRFKIQYALVVVLPLLATWISTKMMGAQMPQQGIGIMQLALAISLLCGVSALLDHYLRIKQSWLVILILAIGFAIATLPRLNASLSLFSLVLPNVLFGGANLWLVKNVFFNKDMVRIRMILFAAGGAISFAVYMAAIHYLINVPLMKGFWTSYAMNGMMIYVFIGFGMSLADLVAIKTEIKELQHTPKEEDEDDLR